MKDFLIKIGLFLKILETNTCKICGTEKTPHGFKGAVDCPNRFDEKHRGRY